MNNKSSQEQQLLIIPEGKIVDFIDGKLREDTPEEYVRQEIEKSIIKEYNYRKENCEIEFTIKVGSNKKRVDIAIFPENKKHIQENCSLLVECKKEKIQTDDRKEGIEQLKSYMASCLNVELGFWTNGKDRLVFRKVPDSSQLKFEEINDIPKFGQTLDEAEKIRYTDLREATGDNLKFTFRRCHDYIAGNQGLQKPEAFWELLKIIFCKIEDERNGNLEFYVTSEERKTLNGQLKIKKRIDKIFNEIKNKKEFSQIFKETENIDLEPRVLAFTVSQLQYYSLLESNVDVKGTAYEEVVGVNLRGDRGEFFTPRNICQMIVKMIDPKLTETVLDPACGTGGFLVIAMNHCIEQIKNNERMHWKDRLNPTDSERRELFRKISEYSKNYIKGLDFNPNLVKATKMNMVMNNDGSGSVFRANSLEHLHKWDDEIKKNFNIDSTNIGIFDIVITNPPFGTKIPVDDPKILEQYDLGHIWERQKDSNDFKMRDDLQKSVPPEILFIERCLQLVKEEGRMAIILPDAILGSPGLGYVRFWILKHAKVIASIDLDKDTFQPKNGTQTSVLFLVKKGKQEIFLENNSNQQIKYPVFMAAADKVGHDKRGHPIYKRDADGNEIVVIVKEEAKEEVDGKMRIRIVENKKRILNDQTEEIADIFSKWKAEKSMGF